MILVSKFTSSEDALNVSSLNTVTERGMNKINSSLPHTERVKQKPGCWRRVSARQVHVVSGGHHQELQS